MSKNNDRKRRYRSDGTSIWGRRSIDGPGVWVSCVKGKEKQTVGELYDLFEQLASDLYPELGEAEQSSEDTDAMQEDQEEEEDLEKQLAKELASMKKPRKQQIFANCQTNTTCVVFISCKPPVDPVRLVLRHIDNVEKTGVTHTRFTQRLTPVSGSCVANVPEIQSLFKRILKLWLEENPDREKSKYKVELRSRNHNTLTRQQLIDTIAACVPSEFSVDLENPKVFVLVEVFKSICGISIVEDYYQHTKFNVMEIANAKNEVENFREGEGRVD